MSCFEVLKFSKDMTFCVDPHSTCINIMSCTDVYKQHRYHSAVTSRSMGYAFVEFSCPDDAENAYQVMLVFLPTAPLSSALLSIQHTNSVCTRAALEP